MEAGGLHHYTKSCPTSHCQNTKLCWVLPKARKHISVQKIGGRLPEEHTYKLHKRAVAHVLDGSITIADQEGDKPLTNKQASLPLRVTNQFAAEMSSKFDALSVANGVGLIVSKSLIASSNPRGSFWRVAFVMLQRPAVSTSCDVIGYCP